MEHDNNVLQEAANIIVFDNLFLEVGNSTPIEIEGSKTRSFVAKNSPGSLSTVDELSDISEIAKASASIFTARFT